VSTLERAIGIAAAAHAGQRDKAGEPYILHPLHVMMQVRDPSARVVAVLHDVVEDSDVTIADLRREGFPRDVLEALALLTKDPAEDYLGYVARVAVDPLAAQVKRADLGHNMDLSRIPSPGPKDLARLAKYRAALAVLDGRDQGT
jgi:hypothetical protein